MRISDVAMRCVPVSTGSSDLRRKALSWRTTAFRLNHFSAFAPSCFNATGGNPASSALAAILTSVPDVREDLLIGSVRCSAVGDGLRGATGGPGSQLKSQLGT